MDIKISDILAARFNEQAAPRERVGQTDFSFTLNKLSDEGLAERLGGLISDITTQGKKLADHMDIRDLKQYKALISDFINEVVTHSHEFSRENFLDRRGRHRVYGIVRLVNQDLDELAQELLKKEKDHILILDRINEIEGLLLDMVV
ncbi:MAG: YaaR family protein [Defluviitaleaceae bacterium]|nr:YaaR family protein [Defluviitaleaceae bacterium]